MYLQFAVLTLIGACSTVYSSVKMNVYHFVVLAGRPSWLWAVVVCGVLLVGVVVTIVIVCVVCCVRRRYR